VLVFFLVVNNEFEIFYRSPLQSVYLPHENTIQKKCSFRGLAADYPILEDYYCTLM
jgi:hypothetical protein